MAKTLDNMVDEIRLMVKDRRVPYRWTQADILSAVNSGYRETKRIRPDIFLAPAGDLALPNFTEPDLGTAASIVVDEVFFMALVNFAVGKLQLGDDEFAVDNRAMSLLAQFERQLRGA